MRKTFVNRNHSFTKEQFDQVMQFGSNLDMQKKWQAFAKKISFDDVEFNEVMNVINNYLQIPFELSIKIR